MEQLSQAFEERLQEIEAYLRFLEDIEIETRSGPPRLKNSGALITTQQQRILYSGVFLQLYNLVEASIVKCLDGVTETALKSDAWAPGDLTSKLRREWVRVMARTHTDMNSEKRLKSALILCEHLVATLPVSGFKLEKGGGGNWDDATIENIATRVGFKLQVKRRTNREIKRKFRDDLGALGLVKKRRNSLAHGGISFAECGENFTVKELRDLTDRISTYMREVVQAFMRYIEDYKYLVPAKRPARVDAR